MTGFDVSAARALCGYTIIDSDGIEQPCDDPGTSWRWYQDVEHEDVLDVACPLHENEGGRRMHAALDEVERLRAALNRMDAHVESIPSMCHWRYDPDRDIDPAEQHKAFHFGRWPGQTGVCPYFAVSEVLRGRPDPRAAASSPVSTTEGQQR